MKVHYCALNPVDWKLLDRATPPGSVLCKDYSGEVVQVGEGVQGWKPGDRICGLAMGGLGGLAGGATEYASVEADLAWHVPESLKLSDAVTFGIGGSTAAFALYHHIGAPYPPAKVESNLWFLVSGGSTSVGLFLIQFAKLAGYRVIATASERNFDLVKSYGSDAAISYADIPAAVAEIQKLHPQAGAELAGGSSWTLSGEALAGAKYVAVLDDPNGRAEHVNLGRAFKPVSKRPASPTDSQNASFTPEVRAWLAEFYRKLPSYIEAHNIRPGPTTVRNGLALVPDGLKELKRGVSGTKLVFRVIE